MDSINQRLCAVFSRLVRDVQHIADNGSAVSQQTLISQQTLERMAVRLEVLLRQLNRLSDSNSMNIGDLLPQLGRVVELFHTMSTYMPDVEPTSTLGRPKYVIDRAQLVNLIECGFSCPRISHMLGVSE